MLKVDILKKILDYNFIENKVQEPQVETVECVKDEIKAMFYHQDFKLSFWDTNYTNVLRYTQDFSCLNRSKLKPTRYPASDVWQTFLIYEAFPLRR